ncbi:MAG: hypothetical protein ACR2HH_10550 [Chthoniobacterales bacterium]
MKWLAGGLTLVNVATLSALLLGVIAGGLAGGTAFLALLLGVVAAVFAFFVTREAPVSVPNEPSTVGGYNFHQIVFWALAGVFAFFAFRAFGWLFYADGNQLKVQSINNLGDLSLHLTYIRNFVSGVALWPENPIYVFSQLRYPAGTDLFNALTVLLGMDIMHGLIWAGLIASLATFYALYRWGGLFAVAGFLFNGGIAGFQLLQTWKFLDYQGDKTIGWKSLPLSMFVTQRGLLYALPAGLLLLCHWRAKYVGRRSDDPERAVTMRVPLLPFWLEFTLYASMPLFHVHTFIALSVVALSLFLFGDSAVRKQLALLVGGAFLPATFLVWLITDHFHAGSFMKWEWGWVQHDGDFAAPFVRFWFVNFGIFLPVVFALLGVIVWRIYRAGWRLEFGTRRDLSFLAPAALLFLFACTIKTAPWEWDNIKIIIWAYLLVLPFLWSELIAHWPEPARTMTCIALFLSGFVSLFGGLVTGLEGFGIGDRAEVDGVGMAVRKISPEARFAAYPTYNHPLLLRGRKVVLGYPGHLWTQGFEYSDPMRRLEHLMKGAPDWREEAKYLRARYLFWGREEKQNYPTSTRPWERDARLVVSGNWGAIYDLESPPAISTTPGE